MKCFSQLRKKPSSCCSGCVANSGLDPVKIHVFNHIASYSCCPQRNLPLSLKNKSPRLELQITKKPLSVIDGGSCTLHMTGCLERRQGCGRILQVDQLSVGWRVVNAETIFQFLLMIGKVMCCCFPASVQAFANVDNGII